LGAKIHGGRGWSLIGHRLKGLDSFERKLPEKGRKAGRRQFSSATFYKFVAVGKPSVRWRLMSNGVDFRVTVMTVIVIASVGTNGTNGTNGMNRIGKVGTWRLCGHAERRK